MTRFRPSRSALSTAALTACSVLALTWPLASMSQVPGEQVVPPASPETDSSTTSELAPLQEEKLNQFADAYLAVEEIQNKAAAELERETDPVQAHEIEAQAETHMIQAVERTGLQLQEFNQIAEAASLNPELREVIIRRVEERRRI